MSDLREDTIRERAFDLYVQRGCLDGLALNDWINAEQQLLHEAASGTAEPVSLSKTKTFAASAGQGSAD
jgi:hypothetical protein